MEIDGIFIYLKQYLEEWR